MSKTPNFDYPEETEGTRIAREIRAIGNNWTTEERARLLNEGLKRIYGQKAPPLPKNKSRSKTRKKSSSGSK